MVSGDALPRLSPEASLRSALDQLRRSGLDGLPVMDAGALAGIVTRRAVAEAIHERLQRSRPGDGAIPGRP
jgi:CBS domain-containing protein